MKSLAVSLAALALFGCAPSTVEPGDGLAEPAPASAPAEAEPSQAAPKVADFKDKHRYPDGVEVEVTKIRHGKLTAEQAQYVDGLKAGMGYTVFTVRVRNGSSAAVELVGAPVVSYGPEGDEAEPTYVLDEAEQFSGKVLPGRAKSAGFVYLLPERWRGDVVLEVSPDFVHESAVFAGSTL